MQSEPTLSGQSDGGAASSAELPPRPTIADVLKAQKVLRRYLAPTPLHNYPVLDAGTGAEVWVKHENYLPIGAFKLRGGINFMAQLSDEQREQGVVTASTGNHGQSVAYAARLFGVKAVIVVPENANPVKLEAMRANGADVRLHGPDFEAAKEHGQRVAVAEDLCFVSSGDEPTLIAGVATHTLEVLQEQPDIEAIIVPLGGGSGASGASLVAKTVNPQIRTVAVCAEASPAAYLTWRGPGLAGSAQSDGCRGIGHRRAFSCCPSRSCGSCWTISSRFPKKRCSRRYECIWRLPKRWRNRPALRRWPRCCDYAASWQARRWRSSSAAATSRRSSCARCWTAVAEQA